MWDGITTVPSACGHRSRVAPRHIWKGNMTGRVRLSGTGHGERGGSFLGSARGMPAGASGNHHTTAWDPTAPLDPSRTDSARREFPQGTRPPSSERTGTLFRQSRAANGASASRSSTRGSARVWTRCSRSWMRRRDAHIHVHVQYRRVSCLVSSSQAVSRVAVPHTCATAYIDIPYTIKMGFLGGRLLHSRPPEPYSAPRARAAGKMGTKVIQSRRPGFFHRTHGTQ